MEKWKKIKGYRGRYEVSNLGRVRSNPTRVNWIRGLTRTVSGYVFTPSLVSGYPAVSLSREGKARKEYVHKLVLETFVGRCPKGKCARHYPDSDKMNNKLSNLKWGTHAENAGDYWNSYITDDDIGEIHRLRDEGWSQQEIADQFNCTQGYISTLLSNQRRPVARPSKNESTRGNWWTDEMFLEILNARKGRGGDTKKLAKKFGVSISLISDIQRGRKMKLRTATLRRRNH